MKKMKSLYAVLLLAFFFAACTQKETKSEVKNSKYCVNELSLLSIPDSIKQITIDYSLKAEPLFNSIAKKLDKDLCLDMTSFGLVLANKEVVKVEVFKKCNHRVFSCFVRHPEVKILLNKKGMLMIENEITSIDSVKFWLGENFPNDNKYDLKEISINWDEKTPKDSIEKVFTMITDGYLQSYNKMSQKLFLKNVCELTIFQVDSLKDKLPIKINLELGKQFVPPPPPIEEQ
jgi:hypothetical protein